MTTVGDLDQLFADLPRPRAAERERRARFGLGLGFPPSPLLPIALVLAVAVVASAHALFFLWPVMFFLLLRLGLLRRAWWGRSHGWQGAYRQY